MAARQFHKRKENSEENSKEGSKEGSKELPLLDSQLTTFRVHFVFNC